MFTLTLRLLLFGTALAVGLALATAGVSKLLDPTDALVFMQTGFNIPVSSGVWIIRGLALCELALGLLLAYGNGRWVWPAHACLVLVGGFIGMLIAVHLRHPNVALHCGCFGALQAPIGGKSILSHLRLDAALVAILAAYIGLLSLQRYRQRTIAARFGAACTPASASAR